MVLKMNIVKQSYFRTIFRKNYNISFGSPATDECSKCIEIKESIKVENRDIERIRFLKTELDVHKRFEKASFGLLKGESSNKNTFSFDCQRKFSSTKNI